MSETGKNMTRELSAGSVVYQEGDESSCMFVVQRGEVEIVRYFGSEPRLLAIVGPGEFFGEMGLINGRPRSATARVRKDALLLEVDGNTFESMLRSRTEIAIRMIMTLSRRLEASNNQVELLMLTMPTHRVVEGIRQLAEAYGVASEDGRSVFVPCTIDQLAGSVMIAASALEPTLVELGQAGLLLDGSSAGEGEPGWIIPDVGKLFEFLDFLDLREQYRAAT